MGGYERLRTRAATLRNEYRLGNFESADVLDPVFNPGRWRLMRLTDRATMVGRERRRRLMVLMEELDVRGVRGDVVELGVFKGGTAAVLGQACARSTLPRHLWLFDSFQGLPEPLPQDGKEAMDYAGGRANGQSSPIGECVGTRREVEDFILGPAGLERDAVSLVEGWYEDTLASAEVGEIALLHLDCDWYKSVRLALDALYDRVVPGGCVVFDDYGEWPGARLAAHEFLGARSLDVSLERGGHTQAYFWKD